MIVKCQKSEHELYQLQGKHWKYYVFYVYTSENYIGKVQGKYPLAVNTSTQSTDEPRRYYSLYLILLMITNLPISIVQQIRTLGDNFTSFFRSNDKNMKQFLRRCYFLYQGSNFKLIFSVFLNSLSFNLNWA